MTEFAGRISRYRPERAGVCSATRPATRTPDGIPYWAPLDLNPYLYFDARVNVSTEGGEVDLWYAQWYGGTAPPNGLSDYLDQGTAEWKPIHSTDGYIQFDNVDTRLEYDPPVSQAGVLICATDNGIFAYEVDADSVDEITALGWERGYFQTLKVYAMTLLPATVSDVQIAGVIQYFEEELGATRNPTGSLYRYWRDRTDLVAPKFSGIDFSGVTSFGDCWFNCTSLTEFPKIDTSSGTAFNYCWYNCSSLTEFPEIDTSSGTNFSNCWYGCTSLEDFPGTLDLSSGTNFSSCWRSCTSLTEFPSELDLSSGTNFSFCWLGCSSLGEFPSELDLSSGTDFSYCWHSCGSLEEFPGDLDLSSGTNFYACWHSCTSLEEFPGTLDLSSGTNFAYCWYNCTSLEEFPGTLDLSSGTSFSSCWRDCSSLENFPANFFDYWSPGTPSSSCFVNGWDGCTSLTATSVENILNSIATSGVDAPASYPDITIDYDDGTGPPDISSAVTTLKACSPAWTITLNGVLQ